MISVEAINIVADNRQRTLNIGWPVSVSSGAIDIRSNGNARIRIVGITAL
jgi:hypothetical protein